TGGDGGGGGTTTTGAKLTLQLLGATKQNVLKRKAVIVQVRCATEACTTVASAKGALKLKAVTQRVASGATRTPKLKLTAKQLASLRKALKRGKRAKLTVTVRAKDAAGAAVTRTLTVTVTR